jgi:hypothetical protein
MRLAVRDVVLATISAQLALDGFQLAIPVIPITFRINTKLKPSRLPIV